LADLITSAAQGQPNFVQGWINFWGSATTGLPNFTVLVAILETIIAMFLLLGFLTPLISAIGIVFNLLIWSTAEGFGGIFQAGATDVGTGPLYAAIFAGLIVIQAGRQKGLDKILHAKFPEVPFW
jgi:nitrite reductase (NO-forming)